MTTGHKALLVTPGVFGLIVGLGWFLIDPKGDARQHLTDHGVRLLDRARNAARF